MTTVERAPRRHQANEAVGAYRRAIRIQARPGVAAAQMEDDVHHFRVALSHADGVVTAVEDEAPRTPWTICPGALAQLKTLQGLRLDKINRLSAATRFEHCLHLFDIVLLAASHAQDSPFDRHYRVEADYDGALPAIRLWRDGREILSWEFDAGRIRGSRFDGVRFADLADHLTEAGQDEAEAVLVLRRASLISGVRTMDLDAISGSPAINSVPRASCYAKQPQRHGQAARAFGSTRDFWADGAWPLEPVQAIGKAPSDRQM